MLLSAKPKDKVILMLSAQSSVVRGTLIRLTQGQIPLIMFNQSENLTLRGRGDKEHHFSMVEKALKSAEESALLRFVIEKRNDDTLPSHISEVHYVLSSPWIISGAKNISKDFGRQTIVTEKGILELIGKERQKYAPQKAESMEIVEEKIFDVRLNGYSVNKWAGKTARTLEVPFAFSMVEKSLAERLYGLLLPTKATISFHSALLLHFLGMEMVSPHRHSFTLAHVHGELTDVLVVKNHNCVFFGSFENGMDIMINKLAEDLGVSEKIADTSLSLWLAGKLEKAEADRVGLSAEKVRKQWMEDFSNLLKSADCEGSLPGEAVITCKKHEDFLAEAFRNHYAGAKVESLGFEELSHAVSFSPKAEQLRVIALYAIALNALK